MLNNREGSSPVRELLEDVGGGGGGAGVGNIPGCCCCCCCCMRAAAIEADVEAVEVAMEVAIPLVAGEGSVAAAAPVAVADASPPALARTRFMSSPEHW